MPELMIWCDGNSRKVTFEGTPRLSDVLEANGFGIQHPCGGCGLCGKCTVDVTGAVSGPDASDHTGIRLACQTILLGDAAVVLSNSYSMEQIELSGIENIHPIAPMPGEFGVAVDIGTTTLALRLFNLKTGECVHEAAMLNPQTSVAADIMGRIQAAMDGKLGLLQTQIQSALHQMLNGYRIDAAVVTGNTTMLYLLTGRNPESLSHAPFDADYLFGTVEQSCYLPPCMNAFVGADITCALLASGVWNTKKTALLCDIGTNGEIALWRNGELFVTSTAAGPAFEGAGISCGCSSIRGAIDRVWIGDGQLCIHTIGEEAPVGICGSGLIDAVAASLKLGLIDETGAMEDDEIILSKGVALLPKDIRAVQLAKAAIAAGIETLLETAGLSAADVDELFIAGGFGRHLRAESAAAIGLIPPQLIQRMHSIGNASLSGATQLLMEQSCWAIAENLAHRAQHLNLGGNPRFNEHYINQMMLPEE